MAVINEQYGATFMEYRRSDGLTPLLLLGDANAVLAELPAACLKVISSINKRRLPATTLVDGSGIIKAMEGTQMVEATAGTPVTDPEVRCCRCERNLAAVVTLLRDIHCRKYRADNVSRS